MGSDKPEVVAGYTPSKDPNTVLFLEGVKVYFALRRSFVDVIRKRPPLYVRAVDGVYLDVKKGEVFGIAGESGCGKTTLGKAIVNLVKPVEGCIGYLPSKRLLQEVGGLYERYRITDHGHLEISSIPDNLLKPLRKEIQMVWQDPYGSLNPRRTVYEILEEPLVIHEIGETKEQRREIVAKALESVKLTPPEDFMERYPHMLSGGQRQRVVIARALILGPRLIVADEPVSMLDVSIRAEILQLMMDLKKQYDLTYVFITHDLALARYISNRIAVMYLGRIVELGDARKTIEEPYHPYTKALAEVIPEPDPSRRFKRAKPSIKGEIPSPVNVPPGCRFHTRCLVPDANPGIRGLCTSREPPLVEVEKGRYVACWLYAKR